MARLVAERVDAIPALGEIFRKHGFEGASLKLISKGTGLGKGSLYHFFPGGKEEMAAAVLEEIAVWFETHVYEPLETMEPDQAVPAMFAAVTSYFKSGSRICLIGAFALDGSKDRFPDRVQCYFERWLLALQACLKRHGHADDRASQIAFEVVGGIQGAIILAQALGRESPFVNAVERLERLCLD
ncbi:TetR family transcriptional regulator [Notoacmeibacter marinus]|uniref:TetR family transcriptional regulator n=1 Tax=Notoacmeibacter marinus TaxID=1876515 RepID=A0A231V1Y6_9HYPH|nr:TetR/AcrR family transcriptional regulator [Notoacmeibacter marinus]OXT02202.1 TetR family transcriptional regulator [Notoacmeibacter marinus]